MIYYALLIPAALFGAVALVLAIALAARGGSRVPLYLTCLVAVLAWACFAA